MFSDELKEGTFQAHTNLEKKLVSRIKEIGTVNDYVRLLRLMFGYYKPLHDKLSAFISENNIANNFSVRSVHKIIEDIECLQPAGHTSIPVCSNTPDLTTHAASLGALYVTEGSTLGGQIITKMICKKLNIPGDRGFSFFRSYGDDTPLMWERFKAVINKPRNENEKNEMMDTAIATFSTFKDWLESNERN